MSNLNDKTEIQYIGHNFNSALEKTKELLANDQSESRIYNFNGRLCYIGTVGIPTTKNMLNGEDISNVVGPISHNINTLRVKLNSLVTYIGDSGAPKSAPQDFLNTLLADPAFAPTISGLTRTPTIAPNGHELIESGFDNLTGLYCNLGINREDLPSNPTHNDAVTAAYKLQDTLLAEFPFKDDIDKSAALAMLLTAFHRKFLTNAPGFMVTATTQASGKSTLVDVIFKVAFGEPAAAAVWSTSEKEMAKLITSLLKKGVHGVNFDNIPLGQRLAGEQLATLITNERYENRLLGGNDTLNASTAILIALTGNQLVPVGDMQNRLIPIRLEPNVENPATRKFEIANIGDWAQANRNEFIKDVYTIIKAWHCAGKPAKEITPTRFPDWDATVRQIINWLPLPDPAILFSINANNDPEREAQTYLFESLYCHFGDKEFTCKDALGDTAGIDDLVLDAMMDYFEGDVPTTHKLGIELSSMDGLVRGGHVLRKVPKSTRSKKSQKYKINLVS